MHKYPIADYLPTILAKKRLLVLFFSTFCMALLCMYSSSHLLMAYRQEQAIERNIAQMQTFLADWTEKTTLLNSAPMRPVREDQIDSVQTNILFSLQAYSLNLTSLKAVQTAKKDEHGHLFEIEFTGSYEATVNCIKNFHARDALLSIKSLDMQQRNGLIQTKMQYKVYAK